METESRIIQSTTEEFRYEVKIPLEYAQALEVPSVFTKLGLRLKQVYPMRSVHSVYIDDINLSDYQDNVSGLSKRQKSRIRWYNQDMESLKLEQKIKRNKRSLKKAWVLENPGLNKVESRIEIQKLARANRGIFNQLGLMAGYPSLKVDYFRKYFELKDEIRLTIDSNISYTRLGIHSPRSLLSSVSCVLEIKFPIHLKKEATAILSGLPFRPFRHSKYVIGIDSTWR